MIILDNEIFKYYIRRMDDKMRIFSDIRTWIVVFFLIRLIGITNPPLEVGHNWRQTTVTMVARNFLEVDSNILYPRVDMAGEKTGITGMEFPIFNYMIYCVSEIFGYQHWYGRLLNLLMSSIGVWFFFLLVRKYFHEKIALYSAIILSVSIWFQFSRKVMPDTFSVSLVIAGIYYGSSYFDSASRDKAWLKLILYSILISIGVLSKLPSGYLLALLLFGLADTTLPLRRKIVFSLVTCIALAPAIVWYFYWVPYLVDAYGFWHFFMGTTLRSGALEILQNGHDTLKNFYDRAMKFIGFGAFIFGLFFVFRARDKRLRNIFMLALLLFSIIMMKAGRTFSHHDYYIIPFVPIMALVAGYGLASLQRTTVAVFILCCIMVEGIGNQQHDFFIHENDRALERLETDLDRVSHRSDLIVINSGHYPTPMYFAHRKGWVASNENILDNNYIMSLQQLGLKYIVILKHSFGSEVALLNYSKALENDDYTVYSVH